MKRIISTAMLTSLLLGGLVFSSDAAEMEHQHPGGEPEMSNDMHEMMMRKMMMQDQGMMAEKPYMRQGVTCPKPCMMDDMAPTRHHMMGTGMGGMMPHRMDQLFFLDQVEQLDLTADQVSRLKAIRSECRKENIRKAAEAKITRLELQDLLSGDDWDLNAVEPLIRQQQTLEGDMLVRHLRARTDARKVLSAEQLEKAGQMGEEDLEDLFK